MHLKRFNLFIFFIFLTNIFASEDILSQDREELLNYSQKKVEQDSLKLKKDWINPVTYTYTHQDGDSTTRSGKSIIAISQPIFKSGGIYSAIKYSSSLRNSNKLALNLEEKELVKQAVTILFNINKNDLLIKKQKLMIKNASIDIANKQESVLNGILDISFLNNAILDSNKQKESLLELEFQKENLINSFDNITAKSYKEFTAPKLKLIDEDLYLKNNLYIKQSKLNSESKQHLKGVVAAKYLPTINANYSYTKNHTTNQNDDAYGFSVVIPLDVKSYNDISSSKLDFLKSKTQEKITIRNEQNLLKTQIAKIKMIDKKIVITQENIKSFKELLVQMKELEQAGIKTKSDVEVLENSQNAETLDIQIFKLDKQIELLELYARVTNEI